MRRGLLPILLLLLALPSIASARRGVVDTVHNLSISGPGEARSEIEERVCVFCHTPHGMPAEVPMWNRRSATGDFIPYESSTQQAMAADMGSSKLCLACHDGTIALGDILGRGNSAGSRRDSLSQKRVANRSRLGKDLRDDHPVAIVYDSALASGDPHLLNPSLVSLPLENGELHCVSCHDPHSNELPPFLLRTTENSELCTSCHLPSGRNWDWMASAHAVSDALPRRGNPWGERKAEWKGLTVGENGCMNCHMTHNATTAPRLIKDREEETCYRCHDGSTASTDIQAEMRKPFRHPVEETPSTGHDAMIAEDPLRMLPHVECEDCHNAHATAQSPPMITLNPSSPADSNHSRPPFANHSIAGVTGIDINGNFKPESEFEYEVCLKCHGVPGKNACGNRRCRTAVSYDMARQDGTYNLREKFDPGNPALRSYHPVVINNPANNDASASLRADSDLNVYYSNIYCGDCHAGERSPAAGGNDPAGPHGSSHEGLLALRYEFDPKSFFAGSASGLCMKCHDSGALFSDAGFPHRRHVLEYGSACINCHDPHGSAVYPHLLNFLLRANVGGRTYRIDGPEGFSAPFWRDDGDRAGTCWLNCHGVAHEGESYPATMNPDSGLP